MDIKLTSLVSKAYAAAGNSTRVLLMTEGFGLAGS